MCIRSDTYPPTLTLACIARQLLDASSRAIVVSGDCSRLPQVLPRHVTYYTTYTGVEDECWCNSLRVHTNEWPCLLGTIARCSLTHCIVCSCPMQRDGRHGAHHVRTVEHVHRHALFRGASDREMRNARAVLWQSLPSQKYEESVA